MYTVSRGQQRNVVHYFQRNLGFRHYFIWQSGSPISAKCRIKISDLYNPNVFDVSDGAFKMWSSSMHIFVDESGTNKQTDHSVFAFAYIEFEQRERVEDRIIAIEQKLNIEPFHWREHSWNIRERFVDAILPLPFSVKVAVLRNPTTPSFALEWSAKHLFVEKVPANIFIDGEKPRWFERQLKKSSAIRVFRFILYTLYDRVLLLAFALPTHSRDYAGLILTNPTENRRFYGIAQNKKSPPFCWAVRLTGKSRLLGTLPHGNLSPDLVIFLYYLKQYFCQGF